MILIIVYREYKFATSIIESIWCQTAFEAQNKFKLLKKRYKIALQTKNLKIKQYVTR